MRAPVCSGDILLFFTQKRLHPIILAGFSGKKIATMGTYPQKKASVYSNYMI